MFKGYSDFIGRLRRYSLGEQKLIITSVVLTVLASATEAISFGLLIPIMESAQNIEGFSSVPLLKWFSDIFARFEQNEKLAWAAGCLLLLTLLRGALVYFSEIASYSIPPRIDARLRMRVYECLHSVSISHLEGLSAGEQSNITAANPARVAISIRFTAIFVANVLIVLMNTAVMAIISPFLTFAMLMILAVLTVLYKRLTSNALTEAGGALTSATSQFSQAFYDTLNGMRMIRLSGSNQDAINQVSDAVNKMRLANLRRLSIEATVFPFFATAIGILFCGTLIGASILGYGDSAALLAAMIATIYLMSRLLGPITLINVSRTNISANLDAFREMDKFFEEVPYHVEIDGTEEFTRLKKDIVFQDVGFSYHGRNEPALDKLSITVRKGERLGIVGLSGSGKSTIINLLTRIYRPGTGKILIDNIALNSLRIESWWQRIAIVMQDQFLIRKSIRENLIQGLPCLPADEKIWAALHIADADMFVQQLPAGLDTILADRGIGLSGGERQRLNLARALLREPDLLILDEATSSVDVQTEATMIARLAESFPDMTLIVIAHRIGAIRTCDRMLILKDGKVARELTRSEALQDGYPSLMEILSNEQQN